MLREWVEAALRARHGYGRALGRGRQRRVADAAHPPEQREEQHQCHAIAPNDRFLAPDPVGQAARPDEKRSEEHTSELQSLMRISYAVFCLKKKKQHKQTKNKKEQTIN